MAVTWSFHALTAASSSALRLSAAAAAAAAMAEDSSFGSCAEVVAMVEDWPEGRGGGCIR